MNVWVQIPLNAEWPFFGLLAFMKAKRPKKAEKKSWSQNAWNCLIRPENQKKIFPTFLAWGPRSPRSEVTRSALFEAADPFYMCRQTFWHTSLVWKWRDVSIPNFLRIYHCGVLRVVIRITILYSCLTFLLVGLCFLFVVSCLTFSIYKPKTFWNLMVK